MIQRGVDLTPFWRIAEALYGYGEGTALPARRKPGSARGEVGPHRYEPESPIVKADNSISAIIPDMRDRPAHRRPRLKLGRALRNLFWAAVDLYAAALVLYLPLRMLVGDDLWPMALMSTFLHWLLLPAFALLLLVLWRRRWPTAALLGVSVVAFLWLFGALFLPQPGAAGHATALTFMTYNVHLAPPDRLAAALRASGADVIALQELDARQAAAMERGLKDAYPHQALYGLGVPGAGLLSRHPIAGHELFYLQNPYIPHMRATLVVDGAPLAVIVAHPPAPVITGPHPFAAADIAALAKLAISGGPAVLLGDFNTTDQSDNYALLTDAGLTDAFRAAGWGLGLTWPRGRLFGVPVPPLVRIDYIWHTQHFDALEAWVGPDNGADHLPVFARLAWR